jgi:hypothetical protein
MEEVKNGRCFKCVVCNTSINWMELDEAHVIKLSAGQSAKTENNLCCSDWCAIDILELNDGTVKHYALNDLLKELLGLKRRNET